MDPLINCYIVVNVIKHKMYWSWLGSQEYIMCHQCPRAIGLGTELISGSLCHVAIICIKKLKSFNQGNKMNN